MVTRTISLGLSTPRPDTSADNYADYEPKYEHWSHVYNGVSIVVILIGSRGDNWQATLAAAVVLLIGWFVLLGRARRDSGTTEAELHDGPSKQ